MNLNKTLLAAALTLLVLPAASAQTTATQSGSGVGAKSPTTTDPMTIILNQATAYPLATCVACGKALPAAPVDYVQGGRLYRLDAQECSKAVDADLAGMAKKIELAVIAQQKPAYPLTTSAVSDKALDATAVDH